MSSFLTVIVALAVAVALVALVLGLYLVSQGDRRWRPMMVSALVAAVFSLALQHGRSTLVADELTEVSHQEPVFE